MRWNIAALTCLGPSIIPLVVLKIAFFAVPPSSTLIRFFAVSCAFAVTGLLLSTLARFRGGSRVTTPLLIGLLITLGFSSFGLFDALKKRALDEDSYFCAQARRDGTAPIPRSNLRYRERLDSDRDGIACELSASGRPTG